MSLIHLRYACTVMTAEIMVNDASGSFELAIQKSEKDLRHEKIWNGRSFHHEATGNVRLYSGCGDETAFHRRCLARVPQRGMLLAALCFF